MAHFDDRKVFVGRRTTTNRFSIALQRNARQLFSVFGYVWYILFGESSFQERKLLWLFASVHVVRNVVHPGNIVFYERNEPIMDDQERSNVKL